MAEAGSNVAPGSPGPSLSWLRTWHVVLVCAAILFYRRPDAFLNPQFFYEDGKEFFKNAHQLGIGSFVVSWTNYLHTASRLVAWLTDLVTVRYAPHVYMLYALLAHLAVVFLLFSDRIRLRWKPVLAVVSVLMPCLGNEAIMNLTNSQWALAQLLVLVAVMDDAANARQKLFDGAALVFLGLSGPFAVVFWPLFVYRWVARRSRHSLLMLGLATAVMSLQATWMVVWPWQVPNRLTALNLLNPIWLGVWGDSITGVMLLGVNAPLYFANSLAMTLLTAVLYTGLAVHAIRTRNHSMLMLLSASFAVLLAASVSWRGQPEVVIQCPRYHFLTRVLLGWTMAQALSGPRWLAWPVGTLLACSLLTAFIDLRSPPYQDHKWAEACRLVDCPGDVIIPITPDSECMVLHNPSDSRSSAQTHSLAQTRPVFDVDYTQVKDRASAAVLRFAKPCYVRGLQIRYKLTGRGPDCIPAEVAWGNAQAQTAPLKMTVDLIPDGQQHLYTLFVGDAIDALLFLPGDGAARFTVDDLLSVE
jgi:hypothetical protein